MVASRDVRRTVISDTQYLAMIDIDEFLFSRAGKNVRCIIQALMCSADVIRITWTVFTSSGHKARPKGLVIDSYNERCQQGGGGANFRSKYIVKTSALVTERDMRHCGVHQCLPPRYARALDMPCSGTSSSTRRQTSQRCGWCLHL